MPDSLPPWVTPTLESLRKPLAGDRFPHALLIIGAEGIGKHLLARALAKVLLCAASGSTRPPCGSCKSCILFAAGNHPDFYEVLPEENKSSIGVDQVRILSANLTLTSGMGARRAAIVYPAELMTHSAANSLLKTLEEPPDGTVLILVSAHPARLPATVRSRCQTIQQVRPTTGEGLSWLHALDASQDWAPLLRLAGGAPLTAVAMKEAGLGQLDAQLATDLLELARGRVDPLEVAKRWEKTGGGRCLEWLQANVQALARARVIVVDIAPDLQKASENINLLHLLDYADQLARARALLDTPANQLLILENVLIPWTRNLDMPVNWQQAGSL